MRSVSSIIVVIAVLLVTCGCNEIQEKHFENLDAAKQEHMIEKGWIPTFIPPDAKDIDFVEDMDAASVHGSYISGDTTLLRKHCSNVEDSLGVPGYGPKWFRDDVKAAGTAGKLRLKGYEVFHCNEDRINVAVVSSRKYVSYWSIRR